MSFTMAAPGPLPAHASFRANFAPPEIERPALQAHQAEGGAWLAARDRAGLHDQMGLGKTRTAIHALDLLGARRVVVVAPKAARDTVWPRELRRWQDVPRKVVVGKSAHDVHMWLKGRYDVLCLTYEGATKHAATLADAMALFDVLVLDEAHYIKTPESGRTKAILGDGCRGADGLAALASHDYFLTGTPAPNDPSDFWTWLRFCGGVDMGAEAFAKRYMAVTHTTYGKRCTPNPAVIGELQSIIEAYRIKRNSDELPPVNMTMREVPGNTQEICALLAEHPAMDAAIQAAAASGDLGNIDIEHIATLRRMIETAKAPAFSELLVQELKDGLEKCVVMCAHTAALDVVAEELARAGIPCGVIDGRTTAAGRHAIVHGFQGEADDKGRRFPGVRVVLGNIRAAGVALTLTAAGQLYMLGSSWAPGDNAQAVMRIRRIGTRHRQLHACFVTLADSIDQTVIRTVVRKTRAVMSIDGDSVLDVAAPGLDHEDDPFAEMAA